MINLHNLKSVIENKSGANPVLLKLGSGDNEFELRLGDLTEKAKKELSKIEKTSHEVEGLFVKDLLVKLMPKEAFGKGPFAGFLMDQFQTAISQEVSKTGAFGVGNLLAGQLKNSILRQEAARILLDPNKGNNKP